MHATETIYSAVLEDSGVQEKDVERIVATGYGRKSIQFADTAVSEITAHAKGV